MILYLPEVTGEKSLGWGGGGRGGEGMGMAEVNVHCVKNSDVTAHKVSHYRKRNQITFLLKRTFDKYRNVAFIQSFAY